MIGSAITDRSRNERRDAPAGVKPWLARKFHPEGQRGEGFDLVLMPRFLGSYARQSVEASYRRAHILANVATEILNGVDRPIVNALA